MLQFHPSTYRICEKPCFRRPRRFFQILYATDINSERYLESAKKLVRTRINEQKRKDPLFVDPYAELLFSGEEPIEDKENGNENNFGEDEGDLIVTRFLDEVLLQATSIVLPDGGEFHQIVLLTPGLDTRPFRLPWPGGTVIYDISTSEIHSFRKSRIDAKTAYGCLHIPISLHSLDALHVVMERSGFRGDRLSAWAIQGLDLSDSEWETLFVEISQLSKSQSLIFGELPFNSSSAVMNFLSRFSLKSTVTALSEKAKLYKRTLSNGDERFVFRAQQGLHSAKELEIYAAHVQAAEETDEDFFGNFS